MYDFTALITCLAVLFYFFTAVQVTRARRAYGIKAPAISGQPDFERMFRVQMNTLEWMPIFLPSLWLFAIYIGDRNAAALGPDLDHRPRSLYDRLHARRRKTRTRLWHSGRCMHCTLARRTRRSYFSDRPRLTPRRAPGRGI